jgi:tRNA nucleotidyltransferase/poly(A) polymerase
VTGDALHRHVSDGIERLAPVRSALRGILASDAERTWLVGGVVRDALLARPLLDVDIATAADPQAVAATVADQLGGVAFPLGDGHGCWRVVIQRTREFVESPLADVTQVDVCALRGDSIQADVDARDFTANALALGLDPDAGLIDRHEGARDVRDGVVRMVSAASLDADPLRMLRAARLAHTLDWSIDTGTVDAIRARAARATEPAGERTFAELELLLLHPEARRGWRQLQQLDLADVLLPELAACRNVEQSSFHHLDVHDHTLAVLDNCEDLLAAHAFWLPLREDAIAAGAHVEPWSRNQQLSVLLAALCHDLGKPATRAIRPDGRVSFVGHDAVGGDIVDAIAERWRWSNALRGSVRKLVTTHLDLGFVLHTPAGARERWRLMRAVDPVVAEAVVLSVSDRLATAGVNDRRRWVRAHIDLARSVWNDHWLARARGPVAPLLDGREIAQFAQVAPGPQIGELVVALAEEQAVGAIVDRDAAITFVRERTNASSD